MSRVLRIEADGGSRGNPGPAGFGAVVKDAATGEVLAEVAESIGRATNNVAEYRGLIAGLRAAQAVDPDARVEVRMDSKLVVEQMSGRWQVKHADMRVLAREARSLAGPHVDYGWIPRAQNSHADRLANEAMDAAAAGRQWQRATTATEPAAPAAAARAVDPDGPPTTLVLVRDAATPLTEQRRMAGRHGEDPGLSEHGRAQAALAATSWDVQDATVVISSTMRRSRETARIVAEALGVEVRADPQWDEVDLGDWDGLTPAEVVERWPREFAAWQESGDVAPPGGESLRTLERRVLAAREEVLRRWAGQRVVLVTHDDPLRVLLRAALGAGPQVQRRIHVDPGSRTVLRYRPDGSAEVLGVNRV